MPFLHDLVVSHEMLRVLLFLLCQPLKGVFGQGILGSIRRLQVILAAVIFQFHGLLDNTQYLVHLTTLLGNMLVCCPVT